MVLLIALIALAIPVFYVPVLYGVAPSMGSVLFGTAVAGAGVICFSLFRQSSRTGRFAVESLKDALFEEAGMILLSTDTPDHSDVRPGLVRTVDQEGETHEWNVEYEKDAVLFVAA